MPDEEKKGPGLIGKACAFIVDKRNLFFLLFTILAIFSAFSRNWVNVENSLAYYLPDTTETKKGLDLMSEEFVTYGSCTFMVANVSYEQGERLARSINEMEGVFSADFKDTPEYYNNGCAKFAVTFDYPEDDERCLEAQDRIKDFLRDCDYYLDTSLGDVSAELIKNEMSTISIIVVIIVLGVLLITTEAYAEIPVLLITFGGAAVLQMGTNFVFGTISYVSDSVTIVLQLALSIDYAIIYLNRYKEEHLTLPPREAAIEALTKAIPEISGSSLTTIGGLIAMTFMQFKMGPDMGIVLIKAILLSLVSVFLLMPGVIMLFAGLMEKTKHRNFIPKITAIAKFDYATRFFMVPVFIAVIIAAFFISNRCHYAYGYSSITPPIRNEAQIAKDMISENFHSPNFVAVIVPAGDYDREKALLADLESRDEVDHAVGLSNTEAIGGYMLTDRLTPRQFSELIDLDYEAAELVYAAYAINDEDYAKAVNGLSDYKVPLIDMFMFVHKEVEEGYVTLDDETWKTLNDACRLMNFAKTQLQGENYVRMLVYLDIPEDEQDRIYSFIDGMHAIAGQYYDECLVCGESVSEYDLKKSFDRDNLVVNIVSILAVLVVLLFTFKSAGMPVLLIAVIQGSIWINFSVPTLMHNDIFFMSYLIVSSIQMGANIDYAIVIASRYTELRETMGRKEAIVDTMNLSFPTIVTSGPMLALAGITIGRLTSDVAIYNIGQCIGLGTIISIGITLFILPQILLVGDTIISKTAFVMNMPLRSRSASGLIRVDGAIRGRINGTVTGTMSAIIRGDVSAFIEAGNMEVVDEAGEEAIEAVGKEAGETVSKESGGTVIEEVSETDSEKGSEAETEKVSEEESGKQSRKEGD
ncbi:MAG: MMPL family transporter [Lachnospiraceae bacterium]|nr:MMPL family transporter [Lachnospiraceae bacterium]